MLARHKIKPGPEVEPQLVRTSSMLARVSFGILIALIVYIGWASYLGYQKQQNTQDVANQGQDLASQVKAECAKGGDVARQLGPLCQQAANLEATPVQGPTGERGPMGPQGVQGPAGPIGEQGVPGPQGQPGVSGPKGETGDTGQAGTAGQNGTPGPKGDPGPAGPQGDPGPAGPEGPQGPGGEPAPRITDVSMDMSSCTGTVTFSDGTSLPINMSGCAPLPVGGG